MINEKYSRKDFTDQSFLDIDPTEFNNTVIVGSQFYQTTAKAIFPIGVVGLEVRHCACDNVLPQVGVTMTGEHTNKGIEMQNDKEPWVVGLADRIPAEPLAKSEYIALGLSIDPADIPALMRAKSIVESTREAL